MPPITALLHTGNDGLRLGRALETLLPCSEILLVDHGSQDRTLRLARAYGARVVDADEGRSPTDYLALARCDWVLCLRPSEALTEGLQAALFEWRLLPGEQVANVPGFSVWVREQIGGARTRARTPETRLVPRNWNRGQGHLPDHEPSSLQLDGEIVRIAFP